MSDCVRTTKGKTSQEPREISLVISLLVDSEDVSRFEPPVLGERLRSARFIIEITLVNFGSRGLYLSCSPMPPSVPSSRTILACRPGMRRPSDSSTGLYPGMQFSRIVPVIAKACVKSSACESPQNRGRKERSTNRFGRTIPVEEGRLQFRLELRARL